MNKYRFVQFYLNWTGKQDNSAEFFTNGSQCSIIIEFIRPNIIKIHTKYRNMRTQRFHAQRDIASGTYTLSISEIEKHPHLNELKLEFDDRDVISMPIDAEKYSFLTGEHNIRNYANR